MIRLKSMLSSLSSAKSLRILELQSLLLNELTTTSDSIKNWRNHVKNILNATCNVVDECFLFIIVLSEEKEKCALEFFWHHQPLPGAREGLEQLVREKLSLDPVFKDAGEFTVVHTTAHTESVARDITAGRIDLRTKDFFFSIPKASGLAGIGLGKQLGRDVRDALIIDNILTALVTIIGSVKAFSAYTKEIERFATRDPLTNLYNQISFWDLLEYETRRAARQQYKFSLLAIDLDNFKSVNDRYGHEVGDALLKDFSSILKTAVRGGDIAARYGGDQFTAILPVCDEGQAYIVANRIIEGFRGYALTVTNKEQVRATVSIGIAVFPDHAKDAKDLYLLADNMVTRAKSFGKDRLSIASGQNDIELIKSMSEKSILIFDAIRLRKIVPFFQPIMNVKDSRIEAYEVLTRIITPDGAIPAADFIETAEGMGALGKIDYQLIELALAKVRENHYSGDLFLNVSPKALVLNEFMPTVRRLLKDYGLDPLKMVFEITERDTIKNIKLVEGFIRELRQEGFRFAIDDFGSGYSSFQYLRSFSVDFLKVDGVFVRTMTSENTIEKAIVRSIASLAASLGIKTIAEYVESKAILEEVASAGIDYAQGYFIQKPSPDLF